MSNYSGFEVTISDIKIDNAGINKLKDIRSGHLSDYDNIKAIYREDYIRFYKAFNYKPENIISTMKIVEEYLIGYDEVKKIGTVWNENESVLEGKIYTYNGKIYIVYVTEHYNFGFPEDYKYTINSTYAEDWSYASSGETDLKTLFNNYKALWNIKDVITNECSKYVYEFTNKNSEK